VQQPQALRLLAAHLARRYAAGLAHAPAQLIAVLTATSNWFAARLQNIPPLLTAATTRSRTSIE